MSCVATVLYCNVHGLLHNKAVPNRILDMLKCGVLASNNALVNIFFFFSSKPQVPS